MSNELNASAFAAFFHELHGYDPFPWQARLANVVCAGAWPATLDLPTASGKTACLDIAVFRMAVTGSGPRRIFFVVDRRVVVDAAFDRMRKIAKALAGATSGTLKHVADRLGEMAQSEPEGRPLEVHQMRGGIYRDDSWVRSPLQPTLIASTVDQTGSRLLFRGYGVSENTLAMHAALTANDSLIFLDEAHCSLPFSETLRAVQKYRQWASGGIGARFEFVEMTATPGAAAGEPFHLDEDDYRALRQRLYAAKPTKLITAKARAKEFEKLAGELVKEAQAVTEVPGMRRIAIMVNRVKTARLAYQLLEKNGRRVHLLIGRMRPVDRATLHPDLQGMLAGATRKADDPLVFVVATQCLEVGADLDFDAVITECASIDALVQRFGRLDRIGKLAASGVTAQGRVLSGADHKDADPVYGAALSNTWRWLRTEGDEVDFGIRSEEGGRTIRERLAISGDAGMRKEAPHAPVLFPAHLDLLAQTSPKPAIEPEIHLYLHGIEDKGSPEVQVVWRADLNGAEPEDWAEIVALCPPVAAEAMPVTLREFRAWLTGKDDSLSTASDVEGADAEGEVPKAPPARQALLWRGEKSKIARSAYELQPGETIVLPVEAEGWSDLGHVPPGRPADCAEEARLQLKRGWLLRLHPNLMSDQHNWPENPAKARLMDAVKDQSADLDGLRECLIDYAASLPKDAPSWLRAMLTKIPLGAAAFDAEAYPSGAGWVVSGWNVEADSGFDESSSGKPVFLDRHLDDVKRETERFAAALIESGEIRSSLSRAAWAHDWGKADMRFQALLRGGDPLAAQFAPRLLAKGAPGKLTRAAREARRASSGLPDGFRHELVSLIMAEQDSELGKDPLALQLVASHHGRCRPFAPVVEDAGPDVSYNGAAIAAALRVERAPHRLDSGVTDRFWKMTRDYGWWGFAYLECLLRLADWKASKEVKK